MPMAMTWLKKSTLMASLFAETGVSYSPGIEQ